MRVVQLSRGRDGLNEVARASCCCSSSRGHCSAVAMTCAVSRRSQYRRLGITLVPGCAIATSRVRIAACTAD